VTVNKMWIEEYDGDIGTFAFDDSGSQTVTSGFQNFYLDTPAGGEKPYYGTGLYFYVKDSYVGKAVAWAEVTVTVDGGESVTGSVSVTLFIQRSASSDYVHQPDDAMSAAERMEDLNSLLLDMAEQIDPDAGNQTFDLQLALGDYEGTMVIPSIFYGEQAELFIYGDADGTTIYGGIDLNGSRIGTVRDVHFKSQDTTAEDKAIYNGHCVGTNNCSFVGYDVALDSTAAGNINPTSENFFLNNEVAVRMDVADLHFDMSRNSWELNTFINNTVAIQLVTLNEFLSPYYIRCTDSNFINNGTDFKASCGGTIYMYRNYYGEYAEKIRPAYGKSGMGHDTLQKLDALLGARSENALKTNHVESCSAKVQTSSNSSGVATTVITNPRWKHPVKNWWHHSNSPNKLIWGTSPAKTFALARTAEEPEYADILVADWDQATQILNNEANSLQMDASAFEGAGEKSIDVVDQSETLLGTWLFDQASNPAALQNEDVSGDFHAGLDIDRSEAQILVEVHDSAVLAAEIPSLLIPCASNADVTFNGKSVDCQLIDGKICFPVSAGGTYVITIYSSAEMENDPADLDLESGTVTVTLSETIGNECVMVAFYSEDGKMLGFAMETPKAGEKDVTLQAQLTKTADYAQIFLVNHQINPLDAILHEN